MRRALRKRRVFDFVPSYLKFCAWSPFFLVGSFSLLLVKKKKTLSMLQCGQCITVASTTFAGSYRQASFRDLKDGAFKGCLDASFMVQTIAELSCRL